MEQYQDDKKLPASETPSQSTPQWRFRYRLQVVQDVSKRSKQTTKVHVHAIANPRTGSLNDSWGVKSVAMMSPAAEIARPMSLAGVSRPKNDVIDKQTYFGAAIKSEKPQNLDVQSNWTPSKLRPVPAFYPLERSTRVIEDTLEDVVARVSEANRVLSIHAVYCNDTATASLLTAEHVEMQLSLWKTGTEELPAIAVELQRRKGDSIIFHRYSRYILDAAVGDFDAQEHVESNGEDFNLVYSKKVQRILTVEPAESASEVDNAIVAIEIAHGLLMRDRMDARQLGLESLCLLTDPNKTGETTALMASRVVLLGSVHDPEAENEGDILYDEGPFQEIRQTILSLVQLRRIGEADEFGEPAALQSEEDAHMTILHNLALAVLANALDVIEDDDDDSSMLEQSSDRAMRNRLNSASSICDSFLEEAEEFSGDKEIIKTLISELGKAGDKPHNACLSAKCIGSLCRASDKARRRAKDLGAKTVVQTALEVGTRTHLKLEKECMKVMTSLRNVTQEED
eukprot:Nitzschia sp. Nitz4//scaffold15_size197535//37208//38900//NITZ4_001561-RA/size197535-processed-gene-0.287-mRNA-1//-1//CDS//3329537664//4241//frame0